ncbi:MAG TPA: hypothetical protein VEK08_16235 [Planctomycetota bacterium]|nr:hypothetical protein [Planctomycetota bacterium]
MAKAAKVKTAKKAKSLAEIVKKFRGLNRSPLLEKLPKDLRRLIENWESLPHHVQDVILILGRVRKISRDKREGYCQTEAVAWRQKRGGDPQWLVSALTILKDSSGYLTDSEISRRVGVNRSTLCRNKAYRNAKRTYLQNFATAGRRGLRESSDHEN